MANETLTVTSETSETTANGTNGNGNGETVKKERAESVRIMNLKQVSEQLELSEQRVRNLVHEDKLTLELRTLEGTDISFNIIPQTSIEAYKELVASGDITSRKRSADHTAYTVYVPNGEQGEKLLALFIEQGVKHSLRSVKKNEDNDGNGETATTSGETTSDNGVVTDTATTNERTRRSNVVASIPE